MITRGFELRPSCMLQQLALRLSGLGGSCYMSEVKVQTLLWSLESVTLNKVRARHHSSFKLSPELKYFNYFLENKQLKPFEKFGRKKLSRFTIRFFVKYNQKINHTI